MLNRDGLHRLLWDASGGPHHTVCVEQVVLCAELLTSPSGLNRALRAMVEERRLDQLSGDRGPAPRTYVVVHPGQWADWWRTSGAANGQQPIPLRPVR